jgi:hypothetical protein
MFRTLIGIAVRCSALALVACLLLWLYSNLYENYFSYSSTNLRFTIGLETGFVSAMIDISRDDGAARTWRLNGMQSVRQDFATRGMDLWTGVKHNFLLPTHRTYPADAPLQRWEFIIPLWLVGLFTFPLPLGAVVRRRWVRRSREDYCRVCGYDLRATRDRCPECGAVPDVK